MGTTFDRYLIARYLQIFVILYLSVFGLFVVIDGFSNVDEFQDHSTTHVELLCSHGVVLRDTSRPCSWICAVRF